MKRPSLMHSVTRSPSTAAQMPVPAALENLLGLRVAVTVERWFLAQGLRSKRCPSCESRPSQTEQTYQLRAGQDRWPFAEAALVLLAIAGLFGHSLAMRGLDQTAFEFWPWSGWILMTIVSGAALVVGLVRLAALALTKPVTVRVQTCARCAIQARNASSARNMVSLGYYVLAMMSLALTSAGLLWPAAICYEADVCTPVALSAQAVFANLTFALFVVVMAGRWIMLIERGRREPALRRKRKSDVDLVVPQGWVGAVNGSAGSR